MDHSENCTSLLEREGAYWAECFSDIPACVLSRLNLTAVKSSCNGSATESFRSSQSGTTCEPSTGNRGEGLLTLCAEDSRARTSARPTQIVQEELTENEVVCGPKWLGWFAKYDHRESLWKIPQCSLFGDLGESSVIWPRWGMMRSGVCWELTTPGHLTVANESGLLPTPNKLATISMWASAEYKCREPLQFNCHTYGTRESGAKLGSNLSWTLAEWHLRNVGRRDTALIPDPCFYEMMMDWPMAWTDLKPLGMDRFQQWLNSHGGC
jgi:hypothetical protein